MGWGDKEKVMETANDIFTAKSERNEKIKKMAEDGQSRVAIAYETGVSIDTVMRVISGRAEVTRRISPAKDTSQLSSRGMNVGHMGKLYFGLPDEKRESIELLAARHPSRSIVAVALDALLEKIERGEREASEFEERRRNRNNIFRNGEDFQ